MSFNAPKPTEVERDDLYLTLDDTRGELNWTGTLQRHWREFKVPNEMPRVTEADDWHGPANGSSATRIELGHGKPVVYLPEPAKSDTRRFVGFHPLQEWEGTVTAIGEDNFTARLTDLTAGKSVAEEEADFLVDDITDDDRVMLVEGAIFRWAVGYERSSGGSKKRVSQIVFRRLPMLTAKDAVKADKEGAKRAAKLNWE